MRHAMANRRHNRTPNNRMGGPRPQQANKSTVFDSNGPDVRIRGTAFQIVEKYQTLAKDAAAAGDRVLAENYHQHAEHYQRMISEMFDEQPRRFHNNERPGGYQNAPTTPEGPTEASETAEPDVVVTRPAAPAPTDEDLGLPASITGAPGTLRAMAAS